MRPPRRSAELLGIGVAFASLGAIQTDTLAEAKPVPAHVLRSAGPTLPTGLAGAEQAFKDTLDAEGPNGCEARMVAQALGITTGAGRAEFINPGNIRLIGRRAVSSRQNPTELGCSDQAPVATANRHARSVVFTLEADKVPAKGASKNSSASARYVKTASGYRLKAVIRQQNEDVLLASVPRSTKDHTSDTLRANVSYGITKAAHQFAGQELHAVDPYQPVICPDGSAITIPRNAVIKAAAIAKVAAHVEAERSFISGKRLSSRAFQRAFQKQVARAKATIKAAADSTKGLQSCDTSPHFPPLKPPYVGLAPGLAGVDLSGADCKAALPNVTAFAVIDTTKGENACLVDEASRFPSYALSFSMDAGILDPAPNSGVIPKACQGNDPLCQAYDDGYTTANRAFLSAPNTAMPAGRAWFLKVAQSEPATWSTVTEENRNRIEGEYDALVADGVATIGIETDKTTWTNIIGEDLQDRLVSWLALGATSLGQAQSECDDTQLRPNDAEAMLAQFTTPDSSVRQDYACGNYTAPGAATGTVDR